VSYISIDQNTKTLRYYPIVFDKATLCVADTTQKEDVAPAKEEVKPPEMNYLATN
jgi:hypothetical protein